MQLVAEYGMSVLTWVLTLLSGLLARWVWVQITNSYVRGVLERTWVEVQAAVREVGQTYTDVLRQGNEDGVLTPEERAEARTQAIAIIKSNLGRKGLKRLMRIVGGDLDQWLGTQVESAVRLEKKSLPRVAA